MDIEACAMNGLPFANDLIIDIHTHLGQFADTPIMYHDPELQVEKFLESMDRVGIDYSCVSMMDALFGDFEGNVLLAKFLNKFKKRLFGWIVLRTDFNADYSQLIDKCLKASDNFIGLKIHPDFEEMHLDDSKYDRIFQIADMMGLIILIHTWEGNANSHPMLLEKAISRYKNTAFLIGHCGGTAKGIDASINLANMYGNVYLDMTAAFLYSGRILEQMVEKTSVDKILFGSDTVFNSVYWDIGNVALAQINIENKKKIMGLNAKKLIEGKTGIKVL